jgi:Nif-specific regulatory protein
MVDSLKETASQSTEVDEPCLVVADGTRCTIHPLVSGKVATLGRSGSNDIVVNHEKSSRQHCEFFFEDDAWYVRDLDSRNGTRLNGDKITGKNILQHGDVLKVAGTRIVFTSKLTAELESIDLPGRDTSATA